MTTKMTNNFEIFIADIFNKKKTLTKHFNSSLNFESS